MALTEVGTKGIKNASIKLEDIENGTSTDAGKFLKNVDGGAPVWDNVSAFTTLTEDASTGDLTVTGTTSDSNLRNITWDKSTTSLSFDDWTYLKFRHTNNSDTGASSIYSVGSELRIASGLTHFWGGSGLQGTMVVSGWSFDWLNIGTDSTSEDQTKLYNGRGSLKWQSKTWGAEYVGTGAVKVPNGTTAQRPTATLGQLRYNTTTNSFEGYQGASAAWGSLGGGAKGNGGNQIFYENGKIIDYDYTVVSTVNAMTAGPVEIAATGNGDSSSVEVVVESGATWTIV